MCMQREEIFRFAIGHPQSNRWSFVFRTVEDACPYSLLYIFVFFLRKQSVIDCKPKERGTKII